MAATAERRDFRTLLREEIVAAQETRGALVRVKLGFIVAALGAGTASEAWLRTPMPELLYLVPLVATVFDLYIAGEDFHVKRIGGFLGASVSKEAREESAWESLVEKNPDRFSQLANPFSSLLCLTAAAAIVGRTDYRTVEFWVWLVGFLAIMAGIWTKSHAENRRIRAAARDFVPGFLAQ